MEDTQDVVVKRPSAEDIEAQANREDQGPISAPATASNTLEGINDIFQLLREALFVAGVLDAK